MKNLRKGSYLDDWLVVARSPDTHNGMHDMHSIVKRSYTDNMI